MNGHAYAARARKGKTSEQIWKWKNGKHGKICEQMRMIGSGLDWNREEFTKSDKLIAAVKEACGDS